MRKGLIAILALMLVVSFALAPAVVSADAPTYDSSLTLENKDASWAVISEDGVQGTLEFNSSGAEFEYRFAATGLQSDTEYCLIYYADFDPRFEQWGGNNPGKYIATIGTNGNGNYAATAGSIDLGMDLPCTPDWNINPNPDYCDNNNGFDSYAHCCGAKIWLVPATAYSIVEDRVTNWNPTAFLFETDLVAYDDTNASSFEATTEVLGDIISISVSPTSIDFGQVNSGTCSSAIWMGITNTGSASVNLSASSSSQFYNDCLQLDASGYQSIVNWAVTGLGVDNTWEPAPKVCIPAGYPAGTYTGTIVFWAEATP